MIKRYTYSDIQRAHVNGDGLPAYLVDADEYDRLEALLREARPAIEHWGNHDLYDRVYDALHSARSGDEKHG